MAGKDQANRRRRFVSLWPVWLVAGGIGLPLLVLTAISYVIPLPPALLQPPPTAPQILDRYGTPLRVLPPVQGSVGASKQLPLTLKQALLAAEDHRFLSHNGVDWMRLLKAGWDNVRSGRIVSGASTITQQLVKISGPHERRSKRRTWKDKVYEMCAARRLERMWPKEKILLEYANRLDLGSLTIGVEQASEFYFGKSAEFLSVSECALLAGVAQAPGRLNPVRHPLASKKRQQLILERMRRLGWLSEEECARLIADPQELKTVGRPFLAPHFVDLLLQSDMGVHGAKIVTSLDLEVQRVAESAVRTHLRRLADKNVTQAAVVVIENATGEVLALVGSGDYQGRRGGQVNGAWAPRSPGSALKPFTYLLALEAGIGADSILADVPTVFETTAGSYEPDNFNKQCVGPVLPRQALGCSLNIPAVSLLHSLGGPFVLQQRLEEYGLRTLQRSAGYYGLGLTIGNAEVRLLELTNAYAGLGRLGVSGPYSLLCGAPRLPMGSSPHAWLIADMLADNTARAPAFGLRSALRFDFPVACKTGTSTSFRDNWALAYTPELTVGVWAGNFDGSPMRNVSGVTGAAPIMHEIMEFLHETRGTTWFAPPEGWHKVALHPSLGKRTNDVDFVEEWFPLGVPLPWVSAGDFDDHGKARLDSRFSQWVGTEDSPFSVMRPQRLVIYHPRPNTRFVLDPDVPGSQWIPLRCEGPNPVEWDVKGMSVVKRGGTTLATGTAGAYEIVARDSVTGESQAVRVELLQR